MSYYDATVELEEQIKQQAAVIEQMREALSYYKDAVCGGDSPGGGYYSLEPDGFVAIKALTLQPCPEVLNKVRADAERYRWLRDTQEGKTVRIMDRREWDNAIDEAIRKEKTE